LLSSRVKQALQRLLNVCKATAPAQWTEKPGRLVFTLADATARRAVASAIRFALRRHKHLFFTPPKLKNTTVFHDNTPFSRTLLLAIISESLELLLDEIEDLVHEKKLSFLQALKKVNIRVPKTTVRHWVPALDGIWSEEEFEVEVHKQIARRMKERKRKINQLRKQKKLSKEIEHVWQQVQDLGLEAQETVCSTLLDRRLK